MLYRCGWFSSKRGDVQRAFATRKPGCPHPVLVSPGCAVGPILFISLKSTFARRYPTRGWGGQEFLGYSCFSSCSIWTRLSRGPSYPFILLPVHLHDFTTTPSLSTNVALMPSFDVLRTIFILSILYNSVFALPEPLQSISSTVGSTFSRGLNNWKKRQTSVPRSVWILEDVYEGSTFFK